MVAWPSQLKPNRQSYKERPAKNIMRSPMDYGPAKVRRRTTSNARPVTFTVFVDKVTANILYDFYVDTLIDGSLSFDFTSVLTGETVKARFTEEPDFSAQETMWSIAVSLELLP